MTVPAGGTVTIDEGATTVSSPTGFTFLGQQVDITVDPDGTIAEPLVLTFSIFAPGIDPSTIAIFKGDPAVEVADCADPGGTSATPDPCVESRAPQGADNALIVVRTSTASPWNFGVSTAPPFDCICVADNVNPNLTTLTGVANGAKGFSGNRRMRVILRGADAPGATCDLGEASAPTSVNLKMVDDDGDIMIDSAKTIVCKGGEEKALKRDVFWQGPLNCKDSAVPAGRFSDGDITATVSIAGQPDFVDVLTLKCFAN